LSFRQSRGVTVRTTHADLQLLSELWRHRHQRHCETVADIRRLIEQAVKDVQEQYVDTRPADEKESARFQLLIATATKNEQAELFSSVGTTLTRVETYECFGVGAFVGHHIIQNAYRPRMRLEQVATIAIHAKGAAKRYVEGVDGLTQFECIKHRAAGGTLSGWFPFDLASLADSEIFTFEDEAAKLLLAMADSEIDEHEFQRKVDAFVQSANEIRANWKRSTDTSDLFRAIRSPK